MDMRPLLCALPLFFLRWLLGLFPPSPKDKPSSLLPYKKAKFVPFFPNNSFRINRPSVCFFSLFPFFCNEGMPVFLPSCRASVTIPVTPLSTQSKPFFFQHAHLPRTTINLSFTSQYHNPRSSKCVAGVPPLPHDSPFSQVNATDIGICP